MKKIFSIFEILILTIFIFGCNSNNEIEIGNKRENIKLYNEYQNNVNSFVNTLEQSNHMNIYIDIDVASESEFYYIREMKKPYQFEVKTNNEHVIYKEKNNNIYEYNCYHYNLFEELYSTKSEFDIKQIEALNLTEDLDISNLVELGINPKKSSVTKEDNTYSFVTYLGKILTKSQKNELDTLINDTIKDSPVPIVFNYKDVIVSFTSIITQKYLQIDCSFTLSMGTYYNHASMPVSIRYFISSEEFESLEISNTTDYLKPNSIDKIYKFSDYSIPIEVLAKDNFYGKVRLEKGTYNITNYLNCPSDELIFTLYDRNKKAINSLYTNNNYYEITENDIYYYRIINNTNTDKYNTINIFKVF